MILTNCRLVGPTATFLGSLEVSSGRIAKIADTPSASPAALDLNGHFLLPGLVEIHTDNFEKHLQPRGSRWPGLPALLSHDAQVAALGVSTVFNAICIGVDSDIHGLPRAFLSDAVRALDQAQHLRADHYLHVRCELPHPDTPALLESVLHHPRLRLASLMDHTPGQRQVTDLARLRRGLERMGPVQDDWFAELIRTESEKQLKYAEPNRRALVSLLQQAKIPIASHDDAHPGHIEEALRDGVTISEFPTTLPAAQAARAAGLKNVMGAPNVILGGSQSGNLSAAEAARAGLVDALSSDYHPVSLLHAAFALSQDLHLPLHETVSWITAQPARMTGLHDRGSLAPGLRADLLEVALIDDIPCVVRVWREGERVA